MDTLTRHRALLLAGVEVREFNASQPRDPRNGEWIDTGVLHKLRDAVAEAIDGATTTWDWRGAHITAPVNGRPVTVTISPFDVASLALLFVPGAQGPAAVVAGARTAQVIMGIRRALQAASVASDVAGAVSVGGRCMVDLAEFRDWKAQPRDPGGEGGGQWVASVAGAAKEALSALEAARDYGDELDSAEPVAGLHITARDQGVLTISSPAGEDVQVHAAPSHREAVDWADAIENLDVDGPVSEEHFAVEASDGGVTVRFGDDSHELDADGVDDLIQALRDMAYITEDSQSVPDDDEPDEPEGDETPIPDEPALARQRSFELLGIEGRRRNYYGSAPGQRNPAGTAGGGQFRNPTQRIVQAIQSWMSAGGRGGDPLAQYSQPQLKTAATALGLNPPKGTRAPVLKSLLIGHVQRQPAGWMYTPTPRAAGVPSSHPPTSGVPVVRMTRAVGGYDVLANGVDIGHVRRSPTGDWFASPPAGGKLTGNVIAGPHRRRQDAVDALIAVMPSPMAPAAPPQGGTPSVSTQPFLSGPFPGKKTSLRVEVGGLHVGAIHEDQSGAWTADPTGSTLRAHFTPPPPNATRAQALAALTNAHAAAAATPAPAQPTAKKVSPAVAGSPDVTSVAIAPRPGTFGPAKESHEIYLGGAKIGTIDRWSYGWVGQDAAGNPVSMGGSTKTDAIRALVAKQYTKTTVPGVTLTNWRDIPGRAPALSTAPNAVSLAVEHNGEDVGDVHYSGNSWMAHPPTGAAYGLSGQPGSGQLYSTKDQAVQALVAAHTQHVVAAAAAAAVAGPAAPAGGPAIKAAQDVLYGVDPKSRTAARQLAVYGALTRAHFDAMDSTEQSAILGDLAYVATTSKSQPTATRARKLIDRFTPPGTPSGTVPKHAPLPPASGSQTRVADPLGTPGLLKLKPKGQRGRSGDGWTRTAAGGSGPWGQYGAAGLMLRHVDPATGDERFLMVQRGPAISDPGKWQFPGGAKEELEDFYEGASREVVEELGLSATDLDLARVHGTHTAEHSGVMVPGLSGGRVPWAYVSIAATVPRQIQPDLSTAHARAETSDAKWMTRAEIDRLDKQGKLLKPLASGALDRNVMTLFPTTTGAGPARPGRVTTKPPRLAGTPKPPRGVTAHKPSRGRNLIADKAAIDTLRQDVKKAAPKYKGKTADERMAAIGAMQGYDDTPTVVSKADFDSLLASGDYIEIWRGVRGAGSGSFRATRGGATSKTKTAAQINEELRSGPAYYGVGIYGNGYYFASDRSIAAGYSDNTTASLLRALLPKSAAWEDADKVTRQAHAVGTQRSKSGSGQDGTLYDEGRYAAAKGLDAVRIPDTGFSHVARPNKPAFNVVNRSILIIQEA